MFRRIFGAALGAGLLVGTLVALLQQAALVPIILRAEVYEAQSNSSHNHSRIMSPARVVSGIAAAMVAAAQAHEAQDPPKQGEESLLVRHMLTWLATILTSVG